MRNGLLALGICWLLGPTAAEAGRVRVILKPVRVPVSAPIASVLPAGELTAVPAALSGSQPPLEVVRTTLVRGEATLDLVPGRWTLAWRNTGFWSPPREVLIEGEGAEEARIVLHAWRAGALKGRIALAEDGPGPAQLSLVFRSAATRPTKSGDLRVPEGAAECRLQAPIWSCELPRDVLDIELRSRGFVTHYVSQIDMSVGETKDMGTVQLRPGASVVGWVRGPDGQPSAQATVRLTRPTGKSVSGRLSKPDASVTATGAGFFQLGPLKPGRYDLEVEQPLTRATVRSVVDVPDREEVRISEPLVLRPPGRVRLVFDPAVHPSGEPWNVRLLQARAEGGQAVVVKHGQVPHDGQWERIELPPGAYLVRVHDQSGGTWLSRQIHLDDADDLATIHVRVPVRRLVGSVKLGSKPLKARVVLGGRHGGIRVPFETDDEGRFSGLFPSSEFFDAKGWPVYIEAENPPLRRQIVETIPVNQASDEAFLDIVLSATRLKGSVVRAKDGAPQEGAIVSVTRLGGAEEFLQTRTGEGETPGTFELQGLAPGQYAVSAEASEMLSEQKLVAVPETAGTAEITLTLVENGRLRGQLVSAQGGPVEGAMVIAIPTSRPFAPVTPATTDAAGNFAVEVPPEAQEVMVNVVAPGFVYELRRHPVVRDRPLTITLSRVGATLVLESEQQFDYGAGLYVVHAGSYENLQMLTRWAAMNGQPATEDSKLIIPKMPAGEYTVCSGVAIGFDLVRGTFPAGSCSSGVLAVGAELRLKVPVPKAAQKAN